MEYSDVTIIVFVTSLVLLATGMIALVVAALLGSGTALLVGLSIFLGGAIGFRVALGRGGREMGHSGGWT